MIVHQTFDEVVYRACSMVHYRAAYGGKGSRFAAGRLNRPGEQAIHAAPESPAAYAEFQGDDLARPQPCVIAAARLGIRRAIDLTGDLSACHPDVRGWHMDWETARDDLALGVAGADCPGWRCKDLAVAAHRSGFVYPSRRHPGGRNVVWYPEDATAGDVLLDAIDDDGMIGKAAKGVV